MNFKNSGLTVLCVAFAACGGSSNDDDSGPPPLAAPLAITSSNAAQATGEAYKASRSSAELTDLADASGVVVSISGASAKGASKPAAKSIQHMLSKTPFGPELLPCELGGSITVSGELEDPLTLTPGDVIRVDAANCDNGMGEIIDGLLELTVDAFSGDYLDGLYDLTMTLNLSNFQVATESDVQSSNGDVTINLSTLTAPAISASVSGDAITLDSNTESVSLLDYSSAQTVDAGMQPSPYTLTSSGTLDSTRLPGSVDYATPVTFEGVANGYPHTGEFLVSGQNSSARLVAIDSSNVRIDLDTNGDGSVDESIETTWAALDQ
jgi:hypothetical protein